jgi:pimeloyl-ACP methyl ester carboxylesterase
MEGLRVLHQVNRTSRRPGRHQVGFGRFSRQGVDRQGPHSQGQISMPKVKANHITMNYDQQGTGEPLILIPYLAANYACYAFQVAEYAKHFTCLSVDLRGTGESDKAFIPANCLRTMSLRLCRLSKGVRTHRSMRRSRSSTRRRWRSCRGTRDRTTRSLLAFPQAWNNEITVVYRDDPSEITVFSVITERPFKLRVSRLNAATCHARARATIHADARAW